jgi:hypothetical protein
LGIAPDPPEPSTTSHRAPGVLVALSGADPRTLARCPSETTRFTAVGGVVLTTAVMAAVSAMFALRTGLAAPWIAVVPIGVLWGLAILNLDRWLVTAARRRRLWRQNLAVTLPRLGLALVIGAVVSTPLVLWIFGPEIRAEIAATQQHRLDAHRTALDRDARFAGLAALEAEVERWQGIADGTSPPSGAEDPTVARLEAEHARLAEQHRAARAAATCELDGACGTGDRGAGPVYQRKQADADELGARLAAVGKQLDAARAGADTRARAGADAARTSAARQVTDRRAELDRLRGLRSAEESRYAAAVRADTGLLARLDALSRLTGNQPTLRTAYLVLLLFITTIEVLPVLVTLMTNAGEPTLYQRVRTLVESNELAAAETDLEHERRLAERERGARSANAEKALPDLVERVMAAERAVHLHRIEAWQQEQTRPRAASGRRSLTPRPVAGR